MGMSSRVLKLGIDKITGDEVITSRFRYCQNKLCGVRNTAFNGKHCSIMCADYDAGEISGKKWVEMHYRFWVNSKIPSEQLRV